MSMTVGITKRATPGYPPGATITTTEPCVIVTIGFSVGDGVDKNHAAQTTMTPIEARAYAKMLENAADAISEKV